MTRRLWALATAIQLSLSSTGIQGAPHEIKVFTDELASYGEHTLETHANKASRAGPQSSQRATPLQLMPEYSYGIRRNWELSLQLPVSEERGHIRSDGYRAELQYVAPHDETEGFYWGVNVELANVRERDEPRFWNTELIPILGLRLERWHLVANPGVNLPISGPARKVNFDPAAKIAYRTFEKNYVGVEYYVEAGPLRDWLPRGRRSRMLYLAWDGKMGKSDFNIGIGRGLSDASDRWVLKMIYEFPF